MLTRLRVQGFKSLEDVEIRFGPLTCIAGVNNAGKSNLFDAVTFLGRLAHMSILDAANSIRNSGIASLFTKTAGQQAQLIKFEADLLVNAGVFDDFGRAGEATSTYLRYDLTLQYVPGGSGQMEGIALVSENLTALPKAGLGKSLGFDVSKDFLSSVYRGARVRDFISTHADVAQISIAREGSSGLPIRFPLEQAHSTVLCRLNLIDYPSALAAKREMQSWITLGMELSALRRPDELYAPAQISPFGAHLPTTLEHVENKEAISSKLASLLPDVDDVFVQIDTERKTKTLYVRSRAGVLHDAKTLSDGVLRFLALAILSADAESGHLLCVEEPENGIHPGRLGVVLELLKGIAVDPTYPVDQDNPLRQVIINTHAPTLLKNLRLDELLICHVYRRDGAALSVYSPLQNTWRARFSGQGHALGLGAVFTYLDGNSDIIPDPSGKLSVGQGYEQQLASLMSK